LAWIKVNVANSATYVFLGKDEYNDQGSCVRAQRSAAVVLIKAGTQWRVYLNVKVGDWLCSCGGEAPRASNVAPKNISHISYFGCK